MTNVNNLRELFSDNGEAATTGGNSQLNATAQLTSIATDIAREIIQKTNADLDKYQELVVESQSSHDAMDKLIAECYDLKTVDNEFLKAEGDEVMNKMIRSQQSKRSRAKSKEMTFDNYLTMMTGAVAENILRIAANKPKVAGGGARRARIEYTDEELQELADNPEALKRAIRNVQSKKSIAKNKSDFDPESERWKTLLKVESQLKEIRDGHSEQMKEAAAAASKVEELIADIDTKDLKAAEAKDMLAQIKEMLASK